MPQLRLTARQLEIVGTVVGAQMARSFRDIQEMPERVYSSEYADDSDRAHRERTVTYFRELEALYKLIATTPADG